MSGESATSRAVSDKGLSDDATPQSHPRIASGGPPTMGRQKLVSRTPPRDSLAESISRLKGVASRARVGAGMQWAHSVLDPTRDPTFLAELGDAYESFGLVPPVARPLGRRESMADYTAEVLEPRRRQIVASYLADLQAMMSELQNKAGQWVLVAADYNRKVLDEKALELLAPKTIKTLHELAKQFVADRQREVPRHVRAVGHTIVLDPALEQVEERLAARFDNEWAKILFAQPNRLTLFLQLAASQEQAEQALKGLLKESRDGIDEFVTKIAKNPDHVWRYPPVIAAACDELGLASEPRSLGFVLAVARARSEGSLGLVFFVAGTAVMAAALLVTGPGAALALGLVDTLVAGMDAYSQALREWENDLASAAGVLGQGQPFTDRSSNYGPVKLATAAALLSTVALPFLFRAFRQSRQAGTIAREASELGESGATAAVRDGDRAATRGTSERGIAESETQGNPRGTREPAELEPTATSGERAPHEDSRVPAPSVEQLPEPLVAPFRTLRERGLVESARAVLDQAATLGRASVKVANRWLDGTLYYVRKLIYFVVDGVEEFAVRIGRKLDDWAFEDGVVTLHGGASVLDDWSRELYKLVRKKFFKTITPDELKLLQRIDEEAWRRIVEYGLGNRSIHSIKGKIAELLIEHTPEFKQAWNRAVAQAAEEGFSRVTFLRDVKGVTVSAQGESIGELTDGMIAGFRQVEGKPPEMRIFAVFESKSPSNVRELAKREGESLGQLAWDYERFRELPTIVDSVEIIDGIPRANRIRFDPENVFVSRSRTEWYGMCPAEKSLSEAKREWIKAGLGVFKPFTAPVRTSVMEEIAKRLVGLLP